MKWKAYLQYFPLYRLGAFHKLMLALRAPEIFMRWTPGVHDEQFLYMTRNVNRYNFGGLENLYIWLIIQ